MDKDTKTENQSTPAVAGQVEFGVRPRAYMLVDKETGDAVTRNYLPEYDHKRWDLKPLYGPEALSADALLLGDSLKLLQAALPHLEAHAPNHLASSVRALLATGPNVRGNGRP